MFVEAGRTLQSFTWGLLWIQHPDRLLNATLYKLDGCFQIRIAANYYGAIEDVINGVNQEMGCKVDVGTFLFGLDDLNIRLLFWCRVCQWHPDNVR